MPTIPLTQGYVTIVDLCDLPRLRQHRWCAMSNGADEIYAVTNRPSEAGRGRIYMHRFIMNAEPGQIIDHVNRNTLDNRRANLRLANRTQNNANGHATGRGASPYKGVARYRSQRHPWRATIQVGGRSIHLGGFATEDEAAAAYDAAARRYFGEFALLNFKES